jgi:hypothetical protein
LYLGQLFYVLALDRKTDSAPLHGKIHDFREVFERGRSDERAIVCAGVAAARRLARKLHETHGGHYFLPYNSAAHFRVLFFADYRGAKPTVAILDDIAFSACYAIASACDQIVVPRTGGTGSVGVVAMHADWSKRLAAEGVKVTIFQYGDRKADGNEYFPLSPEARERFQADIDELGRIFVDTVARNRGMTTAAVRKTQAATYLGAAGVEVGFADAVAAPDEAFQSLLAQLG